MAIEKFCVKCGKKFEAVGREVICPACKESARLEAKRAAVLRAKRAAWTGESVPVRISGRASTVIRAYGAKKGLPFAAALDELLKASDYFKSAGKAWEDITPYKSRRMKQDAASKPQEVNQAVQEVKPTEATASTPEPVVQAAKTSASKTTANKTVKAAGKAASKTTAKTASKAAKK